MITFREFLSSRGVELPSPDSLSSVLPVDVGATMFAARDAVRYLHYLAVKSGMPASVNPIDSVARILEESAHLLPRAYAWASSYRTEYSVVPQASWKVVVRSGREVPSSVSDYDPALRMRRVAGVPTEAWDAARAYESYGAVYAQLDRLLDAPMPESCEVDQEPTVSFGVV